MRTKFINWIQASFDSTEGASAKRLTAFAFMCLIIYTHFRYMDLSNSVEFLMVDCGTLLGALGITSYKDLQNKKIEKQDAQGD